MAMTTNCPATCSTDALAADRRIMRRVSAAGVPIDTPVLYFPGADLASFDLATGLSYPAKAERARRNPRVGLLLEGGPDEPVVSIAGMAAVRDADLQANVAALSGRGRLHPAAQSRLVAGATGGLVLDAHHCRDHPGAHSWWDNPAAMDGPPQRWHAPADTIFPAVGPRAAGQDEQPAEVGGEAVAGPCRSGTGAGRAAICRWSMPMDFRCRCRRCLRLTAEGFALDLPRGIPGRLRARPA